MPDILLDCPKQQVERYLLYSVLCEEPFQEVLVPIEQQLNRLEQWDLTPDWCLAMRQHVTVLAEHLVPSIASLREGALPAAIFLARHSYLIEWTSSLHLAQEVSQWLADYAAAAPFLDSEQQALQRSRIHGHLAALCKKMHQGLTRGP